MQSGQIVDNDYLTARFGDGRLEVEFKPVVDEDVTLSARKPRWQRLLKHELRSIGARLHELTERGWVFSYTPNRDERIGKMITQLRLSIEANLGRPLTARMVEKLLKITKQERLRWGAMGRLGRLPPAKVRRGQPVQVQTYSADTIEQLVADPSVIDSWRRQDAELDGNTLRDASLDR